MLGESWRLKSPTCKPAVAVLPTPPFVEVTFPVTLVNVPGCVPTTVTANVHWPFTPTVAPDSEIVFPPLVVTVPPQAVPVPLTTVSPAGSTSVNATPVSAIELTIGLAIINPRDVVPFTVMSVGLKALAITGGATTNNIALPLLPVPPSFEVTADVVLFFTPAVVPVTFTDNVHEELAAIVPPDKLIAPAAAAAVPPQELVKPLGEETTRPAGKVSVNPTPVNARPLPF